jgi:DNA repair protein RAD16
VKLILQVLTTYSIVESEHRKNVMPDKEECKWCGRKYYPDRLKVHLRFFCGPTARKSDKLALQQKKLPRQYKVRILERT